MRVLCFLLLSAAMAGPAIAGDAGGVPVRVTAIESPQLNLFDAPGAERKKTVSKASVQSQLPLAITDSDADGDYLKVQMAGEGPVWIRKRQVVVDFTVATGCVAQTMAPQSAAVVRGANEQCKIK